MTNHVLINGDSRQMNKIQDKSVHLVITSPPYWQLKDYGTTEQIGFNDSYENYINNLNHVWKECHRVLHDGCRLCINIGDQFARSVYYGRYKVIPIRTEIIKFCETIGFDYMGAIIWQKQTTMNTTGGGAVMGSFPYPRNGILKIDYEFILVFKKQGTAPKPSSQQKQMSELSKDEWNTYFSSHWTFGGARQDGHIAVFPEELPKRLIKMFSFVGETVLDPFMGSGTTALAAKNTDRNSVGYEINPEFKKYYIQKVKGEELDFSGCQFLFDTDCLQKERLDYDQLPYTFHDPLKINKKVDVKKMTFGSVINKDTPQRRDDYHTVIDVRDAKTITLDNGITIRLIGIKEKASVNGEAKAFIREKVKGHKVYMVFDEKKYDNDQYLLCYLYLDNRTFINAHLLKAGLADVDDSYTYKYYNKFKSLNSI